MHHLNVSLVDAYLMVRSRRLSVLIREFFPFRTPLLSDPTVLNTTCFVHVEPNMRLLYNLLGWEIELARKRAQAEGKEDIPLGQGRQFSWPFLAREVHILNERYLS